MACQAIHSWTLSKLIGAFLDLAIAYVLLCCSSFAFFVSKFLGFFGFSLPCPCNGVLSKPSPDLCLQRLLVSSPPERISGVQFSVASRLPFDSVWEGDGDRKLRFTMARENSEKRNLESGGGVIEGEASCSSVFAAKREGEEGKGKGVVRSRKQRGNVRRRRKISTEHTKCVPNCSYDGGVKSGAPIGRLSKYGGGNVGKESSDSSTALESHDVVEPSHVMELDHKLWLSSESNGAMETNKFENKDVGLLGSQNNDAGDSLDYDGGHLENAVKILEQALKEERSARAALFYDLEKERIAAATAADEAMAMIARLQEEKAAIELEARQYERILEEKSTYDAEEMDVLKEIIIRREMEKHFLEKEVESYRKMSQEREQSDEEDALDIQGEILLLPVENERVVTSTDNASISVENAVLDDDSTVEFGASPEESKSSTSHDHGFQEKSVVLIGEMKNEEETESNEHYTDGKGSGDDLHDIHVIDDKCDGQKTQNKNNNAESSMTHDELTSEPFEVQRVDYESRVSELRRHSIATVDNERQKLDSEVGWLREKLRNIQEGREKLNFSKEHRDKGETELMLLEEIGNLLHEIRHLTEPQKSLRRTSLPPPGSKDTSKKRRCRSESVVPYQSS